MNSSASAIKPASVGSLSLECSIGSSWFVDIDRKARDIQHEEVYRGAAASVGVAEAVDDGLLARRRHGSKAAPAAHRLGRKAGRKRERDVRDAGILERASDGRRPELAGAPRVVRDAAKEEAALCGMSFSAFVRTCMIEELAKKGA